jgi:hypothetical protein
MPSLTVREYNGTNGDFVGNISSLSFGRITSGTHSSVKVMDLSFIGVSSVSSVKLGLISSGGLPVNDDPQDIAVDGSASNGYFGIVHSLNFDPIISASPLTRHFAGLNTTGTSGDDKNVEVGTKDDVTSQFIYLDMEIVSSFLGSGTGLYKVFFNFT